MVRKKKKITKTASRGENKKISNQESSTSSDDDSTVKSESNTNDDERTLIIKSTKELGSDVKKPEGPDKGLYNTCIVNFHFSSDENTFTMHVVLCITPKQSLLLNDFLS